MAAIQPSSTGLHLQPGIIDATCSDGPEAPAIPCDGMVDDAYEVAASGLEVDTLRPAALPATPASTLRVRDTSEARAAETT